METNRSIPDDAVSNLGSSVGGIPSNKRVRCKFPCANKATVSYAMVNRNGSPSHMIYRYEFRGQFAFYILECLCTNGAGQRPFGYRGNDFVEAAKSHLRTENHRDAVKERRRQLQSQGVTLAHNFLVIEELGRRVQGCSTALANENNRQFCEERFQHKNKTNLEKYCSYEYPSSGRSRVVSPATVESGSSQHVRSNAFDAVMHGALPVPSSGASSQPLVNRFSRRFVRRQPTLASSANNSASNGTILNKTNRATAHCNGCRSQSACSRGRSARSRREALVPRSQGPSPSLHNVDDRVQNVNDMVIRWRMSLDPSLE